MGAMLTRQLRAQQIRKKTLEMVPPPSFIQPRGALFFGTNTYFTPPYTRKEKLNDRYLREPSPSDEEAQETKQTLSPPKGS